MTIEGDDEHCISSGGFGVRPSVTVTSNTTLVSRLVGSFTLGTIEISTMSKPCVVRAPNPSVANKDNQRRTSSTRRRT